MFIVPITRMDPVAAFDGQEKAAEQPKGSLPFADVLQGAVKNLEEAQAQSQEDAYNLAMGNVDNLAGLMINSAKVETALTMTVQLTSRAVNSYKEIMQMQV